MSQQNLQDQFEATANGWLIVQDPPTGDPVSPVWSPGKISFTLPAGEGPYFFQAPPAYLGNQSKASGGKLGFSLTFDVSPVTFKSTPVLVLKSSGSAIGLSLASPTTTTGNTCSFDITLDESQDWKVLSDSSTASAAQIKAVLQGLTAVLIRADLVTETFTEVALSAVSLDYNPTLDLLISASVYYQDHRLYATWQTSADAYQYEVNISDETGSSVYTERILAASYVAPYTPANSNWAPQAGKTYTLVVVALGPESAPVSVTTVDIAKAVLSIDIHPDGASCSWDTLTGADTYDLYIALQSDPTTYLLKKENNASSPVLLSEADGLQNDTAYTAILRGKAGNSLGDWSDPVSFSLVSARKILSDLQKRLNNNKPSALAVIFSDLTFPPGAGNPDQVFNAVKSAFGLADLTVTLNGTVDLSADGLTLTVNGTAPINASQANLQAVFQVSQELELTLVMKSAFDDSWKLSDTLPALTYTAPDYLYLKDSSLIFSTYAHTDTTVFFTLQSGLNYTGTLLYTADLSPVPAPPDASALSLPIGGFITQDINGASLHFNGQGAATDLTLALTGIPAVTCKQALASIISRAIPNRENQDELVFNALFDQYDQTLPCKVSIPTRLSSEVQFSYSGENSPVLTSLVSAIAPASGTVITDHIPASLQNLSDLKVAGLWYSYDSSNPGTTTASVELTLDTAKTYDLAPGISVGNFSFTIAVDYAKQDDNSISSVYSAEITGDFTLGGLAVDVSLFIPLDSDWMLTLAPKVAGSAALSNISAFTDTEGSSILSTLPVFFQGITNFSLDQIVIRASIMPTDPDQSGSFSPSLTSIGFTINQTQPWTLVPDLLSVSDWSIDLTLANTNGTWAASGLLNGNATLGSGTNSPVFNIHLPVPIGDEGWCVQLSGAGFDIPGLADLLSLAGASGVADILPNGIKEMPGIHVSAFEVYFDASLSVQQLTFQMNTAQEWVLIQDQGLIIDSIETGFTLYNDPQGAYAAGFIDGLLTIGGEQVSVRASRQSKTDPWLLDMTTVTMIHLPGLSELANWMLPGSVVQYLPVSMMPFNDGLDIIDAGMQFDLSSNNLNQLNFILVNSDTWNLIQGYISADNLLIDTTIQNPLGTPGLTLHAEVLLNFGPVGILVTADKASPTADWLFSGTLDKAVAIDFESILASMNLPFTMPYDHGFPRSMILQSVSASANTTQGSFHFAATSSYDWILDFGLSTLSIDALGVDIAIDPKDAAGNHPYTFKANGSFTLASLQTDLAFVTGNHADEKTILTAIVGLGQLANVSVENTVNTLTTTDQQGQQPAQGTKWSAVKPAEFTTPSFSSAYIHVNLTDSLYYLYGSATGFGGAAVIVKKLSDESWAYAFGLNLGTDFLFANILPSLSVIDDYLKITSAGAFFVSYAGSTTSLVADISAIDSFPDKPAGTPVILPVSDLPAISLTEGMFFYGDLDLHTGNLFDKLIQIGAEGTARIIVSGIIDNTDPTNTIFAADLPDITILQTIQLTHQDSYSGIHLTYAPKKNSEFQLAARMNISSVFSKDYSFDGNLTVNELGIDARIALATGTPNQEIANPFFIPGLVVGGLYIQVNYTFGHDAIPAKDGNPAVPATQTVSTYVMGGTVKIGRAPEANQPDNRLVCDTTLALANGTPVLLAINLVQDLSIGDFFAQCITGAGASWPANFINITFRQGARIYYYNKTADTANAYGISGTYTYQEGFNIDATVVLTIIEDISIGITLQAVEDTDGKYKGVIATASLISDPIDLFVLQIASKTVSGGKYAGAPKLVLDTTGTTPAMGFAAGFNFFQHPFGTADLSIREKDNPEEMQLTGKLSSEAEIAPFGNLELDFTYSSSEGFHVTNWPDFALLRDAIDFVSKLKEIVEEASEAGEGVCGTLVDFVIDQAFTTKFSISPSFKSRADKFYVTLSGTYELSALGTPFLTANFPDAVEIPLPNDLSLESLPDAMANGLAGAAESFVRSMLNNPDQIAKFLVIVAGENAAKYAADIVCNGLIEEAAAAAFTAAVEAGMAALAEAGGVLIGGATAIAAALAGILSGGSCFVAGTQVILADGSSRNIEEILIGDLLLGADGEINEVVAYDSPLLGNRKLYAFNGGDHFVTAEHPFMTTEGWKSIDPEATKRENAELTVNSLREGDFLVLADKTVLELSAIDSIEAPSGTQLYNFKLTGNQTYFANQYLVHNKGGGSCFIGGTQVMLADGSIRTIEEIVIGDVLAGMDSLENEVLAFDSPLLGDRLLYSFNGGRYFVTAEHPFMTTEGWKSIDPEATKLENKTLQVKPLKVGDTLILANGTREAIRSIDSRLASPETQLHNFKLSGNQSYFADNYLVHNKGGSCFIAGTQVKMTDGSLKAIEEIVIGDLLAGEGGSVNKVLAYDSPLLGNRKLYAFNGGRYFVTSEHPLMTKEGWKSIDPEATKLENKHLSVKQLQVGDILVLENGAEEQIRSIDSREAAAETQLYNFILSGNHTYFADGYLAHNKGGSCFIAGTRVKLTDGRLKTIEEVVIGDLLAGDAGSENQVLAYDCPLLGNRLLYSLNGGNFFVTAEHPFMTKEGWKSIDPQATLQENKHLQVGRLAEGDMLILENGREERIDTIESRLADPATQLYNFELSGNQTYFADGYLVHNKGGGGSSSGGSSGSGTNPGVPNNVLTYDSVSVTVDWDATTYAAGYELQVVKPDGSLLLPLTSYPNTTSPLQAVVDISDETLPTGSYSFQLRSVRGNFRSEWNTKTLIKPDAPANVALTYSVTDDKLSVSWDAVASQSNYTVVLLLNDAVSQTLTSDQPSLKTDAAALAAGSYRVKVRSTENTGYIPGMFAAAANVVVKPAAPVSPVISGSGNTLSVSWQAADSDTDYEVNILNNGVLYTSKDSSEKNVSFDTTDFPAGAYTAQIRSKGNDTHLPGDYSVVTEAVTKLAAPQTITFSYNTPNSQFVIGWDALAGNNGYHAQIVDQETKAVIAAVSEAAADATTVTIPIANFNGTGPGNNFIAEVRATAPAGGLDSSLADSTAAVSRISAPQNITFSYNTPNSQFVIGWNALAGNNGFHAQIVDQETKAVIAAVSEVAPDATTVTIPLTGFNGNGPGNNFIAEVRTIAPAGELDSPYTDSTAAVSRISAPQNITFSYDTANSRFVVGWDALAGNNGFHIQLVDQETKAIIAAVSEAAADTTSVIIPISEFSGGGPGNSFIAEVRTVAPAGRLDSAYSDSTAVNRISAPQNVTFSYDTPNSQFVIGWDALTGNNGYYVQIVDQETKVIIAAVSEVAPDATTVMIPLIGFNGNGPGNNFIAEVRTIAPAGELDSTYSDSTAVVSRISAPQNITFSYDTPNSQFVIGWDALIGNNGYHIQIVDMETKAVIAATAEARIDATTMAVLITDFHAAGPGNSFIAEVRTVAPAGQLDSVYSDSTAVVSRISAPRNVTFSYDTPNSQFVIGWDALAGNNGYHAQIVDQETKAIIAAVSEAVSDATTVTIPLTGFNGDGPGNSFIAEVMTLAPAGEVHSAYTDSTTALSRLASPTLLPLNLTGNLLTVAIAGTIEGAEQYTANLIAAGIPDNPVPMTVAGTGAQAQFTLDASQANIDIQVQITVSGTGYIPCVPVVSTDSVTYTPGHLFDNQGEIHLMCHGQILSTWYKQGDPFFSSVAAGNWDGHFLKIFPVDEANPESGYLLGDPGWYISTQTLPLPFSNDTLKLTKNREDAAIFVPFEGPNNTLQLRQHVSQGNNAMTFRTDGGVVQLNPVLSSDQAPSFQFLSYELRPKTTPLGVPDLAPLVSDDAVSVTLKLNSLTQDADGYEAQLVSDQIPVGEIVIMLPITSGGSDYAASFTPGSGKTFQVQCRAKKVGNDPGEWALSTLINKLDAPEIISLAFQDGAVTFSMTSTLNETGFSAELIVNGTPSGQVLNPDGSGHIKFAVTPYPSGTTFQVRARSTAANWLSSDWAISTDTLTQPATEVPYLSFGAGNSTSIDIPGYDYSEFSGGINGVNCLVNPNQGFAASAWIRPVDKGNSLPVIVLRGQSGNGAYLLPDSDSVMVLFVENGHLTVHAMLPSSWDRGVPGPAVLQELAGNIPVAYGEWTLVTLAVQYGCLVRIFVNGQADTTAQWNTWNAFGNRFTFGRHQNQSFTGDMTCLSLWRLPYYSTPEIVAQTPQEGYTSGQIVQLELQGLGGFWIPANGELVVTDLTAVGHPAKITTDLLHFWNFDEPSGTEALDSSGAQNGTLSPSVIRETPGKTGPGAIHIDGSDGSFVTFGTEVGQFGTLDFTVAFWFKTTETIRYFDLAGNRTAASHGNFLSIRMTGIHETMPQGQVTIEVDQDGNGTNYIAIDGSSRTGLNDGQWHHMAAVRYGATLKLFIDGQPAGVAYGFGVADINNGNEFKIGRSLQMDVDRFAPDASFDSLYIFREALSDSRIAELFNQS